MELMSRLEEANATNFIHNVLHVGSYVVDPDSTGAAELIGSTIENVGNGLDVLMNYSIYEDLWGGFVGPDISDTLSPGPGATTVFHNDFGDVVGLRYPGLGVQAPGRLVLLSCPLDAVPISNGVNDRIHLLRNVIAFLAPGVFGSADVSLDSSAYGLPSVINVEVGDADRAGLGTVTANVSSTTESAGFNLTLVEGATRGVFAGSVVLLSSTNPPTPGKLRAQNGDDVTLKYFDASAGTYVSASAVVDTNAPLISFPPTPDPDFELATIYWETSEPADALVQFGESPLLGRTAYIGDPTTDHAVTLFVWSPIANTITRSSVGISQAIP
jgi:hypothetical protein